MDNFACIGWLFLVGAAFFLAAGIIWILSHHPKEESAVQIQALVDCEEKTEEFKNWEQELMARKRKLDEDGVSLDIGTPGWRLAKFANRKNKSPFSHDADGSKIRRIQEKFGY